MRKKTKLNVSMTLGILDEVNKQQDILVDEFRAMDGKSRQDVLATLHTKMTEATTRFLPDNHVDLDDLYKQDQMMAMALTSNDKIGTLNAFLKKLHMDLCVEEMLEDTPTT
jgi:hypothetical protein